MRSFISVILSAVLLFSLSGCTGSSSSQNQSQPNTTNQGTGMTNQGTGTANQGAGTTNHQNEIDPQNTKYIKGFIQNKNQSFAVNLKSWGNVEFVSGKITGGNHIPTVFYLTNENGDILYRFDDPFPYNVDVKAISFEDINKDGLKDIIIIVSQNDNAGNPIAAVCLQNANKTFTFSNLDQEINNSGNGKDITHVRDYLSMHM